MTRVVAILQARMGSSRLPGKMLMDVAGRSLLWRCVERAQAIPDLQAVVLATTDSPEDQRLLTEAHEAGIEGFAGSPDDVLDRYYQAVRWTGADVVMRLTGDCPLLDPFVSHQVLEKFGQSGVDYVSNTMPPSYPDGLDTEVFTFDVLKLAWEEAELKSDREHVTQFIRRQPDRFSWDNVESPKDLTAHRWTVDEAEDLEFVRAVYQGIHRRKWKGQDHTEVLKVIQQDSLQDASNRYERNEGLAKSLREDSITPADTNTSTKIAR